MPAEVESNPAVATGDGDQARRVLVLFAHPSIDRSEANRPMAEATAAVDGVTFVDLYAEYPQLDIDIDTEQQRLTQHDVVVFLHPLYWYSTPAILKEWQDLVLEHGFAYGTDGDALHGKVFLCALTAGGPEAAYRAEGYNHFTIRELLTPIEQMARLCGMTYLPPFALFSARTAVDEGRIGAHVADWVRVLEALRDHRLDLERAERLPTLNADLDRIVTEG
ncbi:MAG: NAD(P)H-dependent oxidoreductase [Deltaproteobacteria bacterium]|jgi:putative NADPH-quinone reductase|nr:NAD(P)H-dependent oxidoreductase [Deltaproteobacteria bacterium]MBW2535291.1 NAD(P)H-dependent oxidoreductase [Deltaproteobacteria bacterium]